MLGLRMEDASDLILTFIEALFDEGALNRVIAFEELEVDCRAEGPHAGGTHCFVGTNRAGNDVRPQKAFELGGKPSSVLEEHPSGLR
jgi:hypothetical protein